ncbi:MAG: transglycosylase SLT domain-containing protein [Deltaproteobacteria bacterium]|nr:transglycosylase SLT domain-containing protein [Deltaproteobacteria bacterium]
MYVIPKVIQRALNIAKPICPQLLAVLLICLGSAGHTGRIRAANLQPYFNDPALAALHWAVASGNGDKVVAKIQQAYRRAERSQKRPLRLLLARALLQDKQYDRATAHFSALVLSYPLLGDYMRYFLSIAHYRAGRFAEAAQTARKVSTESAIYTDAQLVLAEALRAIGDEQGEIAIWKSYVTRYARSGRAGEAYLRIGEVLAKDKRTHRDALTALKNAVVKTPLSRQASRARELLKELSEQLPDGAKLATLSIDERFDQARSFYGAMRHQQARQAIEQLLALGPALPAKMRCEASYMQADATYRSRDRVAAARLFADAAKHCATAGQNLLAIKSLFKRGRCLIRTGAYQQAADQFLSIQKAHSKHSYADDALLRAAEAAAEYAPQDQVTALLARIPRTYPDGDMAPEALWRLARQAYLSRRYQDAIRYLERIEARGRAQFYYSKGRALYWKARAQTRLGRKQAALQTYTTLLDRYPLSYYVLLALNRLRNERRQAYQAALSRLFAPIAKGKQSWNLVEPALDSAQRRAFRRGIELARLQMGDHAARELARCDLRISSATKPQRLWLAAVLYDAAGLWHLSHRAPRRVDQSWKQSYPHGDNLRRWQLAYPRAFASAVRARAHKERLPAALIWAIMREESGFSPTIESYANAVGLMQLILPTARRVARPLGIRATAETLRDPATNIALGASYLGQLKHEFSGQLPLIIAGYNAGGAAVSRWLTKRRHLPLDEFIELIPYDQTRRYTKRVLASVLTYHALYGARQPPRLAFGLPKHIRSSADKVRPRGKAKRRGARHKSRSR